MIDIFVTIGIVILGIASAFTACFYLGKAIILTIHGK